jgi:hypothetical protein
MPVLPVMAKGLNRKIAVQDGIGKKQETQITRAKKAVSMVQVIECLCNKKP